MDGENLVMRYQEMLAAGRAPSSGVVHIPDVFVWHPRLTSDLALRSVFRVSYFTSVVGDDVRIAEVRRAIAANTFTSSTDNGGLDGRIVPTVFKKESRRQKTRNVDIQVVIDVMRYAFTDEVDRV